MYEVMTAKGPAAVRLFGKTFRKQIMRFGVFRHPNPWFWEEEDMNWTFDQEMAQIVINHFNNGVVDQVRLLGTHDEDKDAISEVKGVIVGLEQTDVGLDAIIEVHDEKTIEAIETIAGDGKSLAASVSVGLDFNFPNENAAEPVFYEGPVLRHVALVTIPWISGMSDWETVEAAAKASKKTINFGHEKYTGIPVVHESETNVDMSNIRKALSVIAAGRGVTIEAAAKAFDIDLNTTDTDDVEKVKTSDGKDLEQALKDNLKFLANALPGGDDDDEDDEDDDDDDDEDDDANDAVKAAEAIIEKQTAALTKKLNKSLAQVNAGLATLAQQQEVQRKNEANEFASGLIKAGKILPAEKETWVNGWLANKEHTEALSATLQPKVKFGSEMGQAPDPEKLYGDYDDAKVDERVAYYASKISPSEAGREDRINKKENN